jgi:hypothetical protein
MKLFYSQFYAKIFKKNLHEWMYTRILNPNIHKYAQLFSLTKMHFQVEGFLSAMLHCIFCYQIAWLWASMRGPLSLSDCGKWYQPSITVNPTTHSSSTNKKKQNKNQLPGVEDTFWQSMVSALPMAAGIDASGPADYPLWDWMTLQ